MRDLTLAFASAPKRKTKSSLSTRTLNLSLLSAIVFFTLLYLFQVNFLSTAGYQIRKLEQQIRVLESEQKTLQLESSDLQSISRVQTEAKKLNFVPATNAVYLKDTDFALK